MENECFADWSFLGSGGSGSSSTAPDSRHFGVPPGLTALLRSIAAYFGFRASAKIVIRTKKINAKDGLRQRGFTTASV